MNVKAIIRYIGLVLIVDAAFMLPALAIAVFCGETVSLYSFVISISVTLVFGIILSLVKSDRAIYAREGFVTVSLCWIMISIFGALPFIISGAIPHPIDALFETVSGFTTTGASVLNDIEILPQSLLYWRSFTNWLGGMGVLVFLLAMLPLTKGNGETMYLLRAESPGPSVGKLTPTIRQTSIYLYGIYIALTVIQVILLLFGKMSLFDAVTCAFSTAGTGGFSVKNASIGYYDSTYLQAVIGIFMALFGVNFSVYYLFIAKKFKAAVKNEEVRTYILVMLAATVLIGINIMPSYTNTGKAFLDSFFQVSSIMTTTGFSTANFDLWPQFSRFLLLLLMILGACAGSTGGGIKVSRFLILMKYLRNKLRAMLHPRKVSTLKLDGKYVEDLVVHDVSVFLIAYCAIFIISIMLISLNNVSTDTTLSSVLACLNNIGPGLHIVGPVGNYSSLSYLSKSVLIFDMLAGRLELFPLLILMSPKTWKK